MPSFDIVSEIDIPEVKNAVENATRELTNRWDFRNIVASFEFNDKNNTIKVSSESNFQVNQLIDILKDKLIKRGVSSKSLDIPTDFIHSGKTYYCEIKLKQGIDPALAKKLVKLIKDSKLKTQTQIQGEQLRITGKSRDDLQAVISLVKDVDFDQPFQYINFRD